MPDSAFENQLNSNFLFKQIRKYNQATRQFYKDRALLAIGLHTGLLRKESAIAPELSEQERRRVLYFCRQFLKTQNLTIELKGV